MGFKVGPLVGCEEREGCLMIDHQQVGWLAIIIIVG